MMKVVTRCWWAVALQLCLAMCFSGVSSTPSFPGCNLMKPEDALSLGDGVCDMLYNIQDCGYDGGDVRVLRDVTDCWYSFRLVVRDVTENSPVYTLLRGVESGGN